MDTGIFKRSLGDSIVQTNLQTVAVVQTHLLALGIVPPGTSVQVCTERKTAMQVLFEERMGVASSSSLVEIKLFLSVACMCIRL